LLLKLNGFLRGASIIYLEIISKKNSRELRAQKRRRHQLFHLDKYDESIKHPFEEYIKSILKNPKLNIYEND